MNKNIGNAGKILLVELQGYERQGITIFLEGERSNPIEVTNAVNIKEDISYMRDDVFSQGEVREIHFDRVTRK